MSFVCFRDLQRALSVEDVGRPSAVRSVGRVAQAFPDGTILLELSRPPNGPFGFLISRGKGRPDSGNRPPADVHMICTDFIVSKFKMVIDWAARLVYFYIK